jgi:hypothetical protein
MKAGKGTRKRAGKAKAVDGVREAFASSGARFSREVVPSENEVGGMVCLVSTNRKYGEALVEALSKTLRMREAASLEAAGKTLFLFPATGLAVLLFGALESTKPELGVGPVGGSRLELELAQLLSRPRLLAESAEHLLDKAGRFAHVVALVVDDLDLYKYLSVHVSSANVALVACQGMAGAQQHMIKLAQTQLLWKSAMRQQMTKDFMSKCVETTVSSPALLALSWGSLGVNNADQLAGSDLLDLLSARASVAVCQEVPTT